MTHSLVDHINTGTLTKMDGSLVEQLVTSLLQLISTIQLRNQKYSLNRLKEIFFHILGSVRKATLNPPSFKVNPKLSGSKKTPLDSDTVTFSSKTPRWLEIRKEMEFELQNVSYVIDIVRSLNFNDFLSHLKVPPYGSQPQSDCPT